MIGSDIESQLKQFICQRVVSEVIVNQGPAECGVSIPRIPFQHILQPGTSVCVCVCVCAYGCGCVCVGVRVGV